MKWLLITGADSFGGSSVQAHLAQWLNKYAVSVLDTQVADWRDTDFSPYDAVFHVAGLAHADVIREREALHYKVHPDLTTEHDRHGTNIPKSGRTGWAQINGRDGLEIPVKASFDDDYTAHLACDGFHAFSVDCHCFLVTVFSVVRGDDVGEGRARVQRKQGMDHFSDSTPAKEIAEEKGITECEKTDAPARIVLDKSKNLSLVALAKTNNSP